MTKLRGIVTSNVISLEKLQKLPEELCQALKLHKFHKFLESSLSSLNNELFANSEFTFNDVSMINSN